MNYQKIRFSALIILVAVSGFSQGMLLPLIAIIFEQDGVSSGLNGLNATGLYLGILLISPFMEIPLRKFGYKPLIFFGGLSVIIAFLLFPILDSFWFWFILRMIIGIGDHTLHFTTQTWITAFTPVNKRGRNISIYGLSFGIGFAVGPLLTNLIEVNRALPFIVASAISLIAWLTVFLLKNEFPDEDLETTNVFGTLHRFKKVAKYAWVAFLPPFGYGFLEASLNGNFPIYALRINMDVQQVSIILPAFAAGSIITQIPLGILSDSLGRKRVLQYVLFSGFAIFLTAALIEQTVTGLFICFFIAGMLVGSTFSLGISYMTDLLPTQLLPAGNIICGIVFSLGSISGPFFGGLAIQYLPNGNFLLVISVILLLIFIALSRFKRNPINDQIQTSV
ncbi:MULTISPECIES: MFS transporter [unclassified Bacillus (in: firmicutes)]|uniref:MFS transporter n=1 Tax=unclassified Bacillus (in: firmicutes) TaxID=185979 RepID=UPI00080ACB84|nr:MULTISPECIES: MFS transporter [unclassified Bacillus (in: firmicutes)]OCA82607.1 MFS transporter [Bacillus sp. FJAT-27986]